MNSKNVTEVHKKRSATKVNGLMGSKKKVHLNLRSCVPRRKHFWHAVFVS